MLFARGIADVSILVDRVCDNNGSAAKAEFAVNDDIAQTLSVVTAIEARYFFIAIILLIFTPQAVAKSNVAKVVRLVVIFDLRPIESRVDAKSCRENGEAFALQRPLTGRMESRWLRAILSIKY